MPRAKVSVEIDSETVATTAKKIVKEHDLKDGFIRDSKIRPGKAKAEKAEHSCLGTIISRQSICAENSPIIFLGQELALIH